MLALDPKDWRNVAQEALSNIPVMLPMLLHHLSSKSQDNPFAYTPPIVSFHLQEASNRRWLYPPRHFLPGISREPMYFSLVHMVIWFNCPIEVNCSLTNLTITLGGGIVAQAPGWGGSEVTGGRLL